MRLSIWMFYFTILLLFSCRNISSKSESGTPHIGHDATSTFGYADSINSGLIEQDTMKKSVPRMCMKTIGNTHIHINYYSPGVKGRIIWGGLVPYNTVWVTGAHNATKITFNNDIEIDNKRVKAGSYAIFTIPGEKEWIFILNKNYEQHLTDNYSEQEDVLRVSIKPKENNMTQRLTYEIYEQNINSGQILISWEKQKLVVPFKITD